MAFQLAYLYLTLAHFKVKVMHILTVNILETATARRNITISNTESRKLPLDWHIYILGHANLE